MGWVERLEEILIDYLGAKDTEYVRAVTRNLSGCCGQGNGARH